MKSLIFFEILISFEIVWDLVHQLNSENIGLCVSAVALHYINFILKILVMQFDYQTLQYWLGIMLSESISMGLLFLIWNDTINYIQILIVIQSAWVFNLQKMYSPCIVYMIYMTSLEIFRQYNSLFGVIKTGIYFLLFCIVAYLRKPQHPPKFEEISVKLDLRHHILELVPWLTDSKFIVLNEELLLQYEQGGISQYYDNEDEESPQILAQTMVDQLLLAKCESISLSIQKLLQSPQQKKRVLGRPDIKTICSAIFDIKECATQYYSVSDIDNKYFKLSNIKLNFIALNNVSAFENVMIIHFEQTLEKRNQSKSQNTLSQQNVSAFNKQQIESTLTNNTTSISSTLLSNMFSSVSHEFGTYLNCIMTISQEGLKDPKISEDLKSIYFQPIQINSQQLNYILRNIRDYNTILLNQFALRLQEFKPQEMIQEIVELMQKQTEFRSNNILINCSNELIIYNDAERYKQIIYQMLSNAIRFTKQGQIGIEVQELTQNKIKTIITDTGIGMSITDSLKLSEMLKDSKKMLKVSKNSVGCGLGLSISNVIAKKMSNGKGIHFQTTENQGSKFFFTINSSQQLYNESVYQTSKASNTYVKVLNETYYLEQPPSDGSIREMHFSQKYEASIQSGSGETVKMLRAMGNRKQSSETQNQFMHRISEVSKFHTANMQIDQDEDEDEENDNDIDSYRGQSMQAIPSLETNFKTQIIQYNISSKCCSRVLIVDDEAFNIISMQLILSKFQVKSDNAINGSDAIEKIIFKREHPCNKCYCNGYALIFLDINMPIMDGIEAVRIIQQKINANQIPRALCIANSGYADLVTKQMALKAGMNYYLTKPIDIKDLELYLKKKFPLHECH